MSDNRRNFLKKGALLGLAGLAKTLVGNDRLNSAEQLSGELLSDNHFKLPPLPYPYNAMEPFIDKQTMEIHHTKHHQGYVNKLNETPSTNIDYLSSDEVKCTHINTTTSAVIRNNLGGHYNHSLFWTLLRPNTEGYANLPEGSLAKAIEKEFQSFDAFKKEFSEKALKFFGSGWCWLIKTNEGKLKIVSTANQDNPLMQLGSERGKPVLALDVWEHAYYLKYQNKRADYINGWWNIINWTEAEKLFKTA